MSTIDMSHLPPLFKATILYTFFRERIIAFVNKNIHKRTVGSKRFFSFLNIRPFNCLQQNSFLNYSKLLKEIYTKVPISAFNRMSELGGAFSGKTCIFNGNVH